MARRTIILSAVLTARSLPVIWCLRPSAAVRCDKGLQVELSDPPTYQVTHGQRARPARRILHGSGSLECEADL